MFCWDSTIHAVFNSIFTDERTQFTKLVKGAHLTKGIVQIYERKESLKKTQKNMYIQHSFHVPLADDQGVGFPVPRAEVLHRRRRRRHN